MGGALVGGWLVGWLVGWLGSWSVGWLVWEKRSFRAACNNSHHIVLPVTMRPTQNTTFAAAAKKYNFMGYFWLLTWFCHISSLLWITHVGGQPFLITAMKSYAPGTVTSTILPHSLIKQISDGMIFSTFWFNEKLVFFCKSLDEDDKAYSFLFFCDGGLV